MVKKNAERETEIMFIDLFEHTLRMMRHFGIIGQDDVIAINNLFRDRLKRKKTGKDDRYTGEVQHREVVKQPLYKYKTATLEKDPLFDN